MTGTLLLRGLGSSGTDRRPLTEAEERAVCEAAGHLVAFAVQPAGAAIVHVTAGGTSIGWNAAGALRLGHSLPPGSAGLSRAILDRQSGGLLTRQLRRPARRSRSASTSAPSSSANAPSHIQTIVTTTADSDPQALLYEPKLAT
jgi:hypothetical protein